MAQQVTHDHGAAQHSISEFPDSAVGVTVGYYNVGIQLAEWKGKRWWEKEGRLRADIANTFGHSCVSL